MLAGDTAVRTSERHRQFVEMLSIEALYYQIFRSFVNDDREQMELYIQLAHTMTTVYDVAAVIPHNFHVLFQLLTSFDSSLTDASKMLAFHAIVVEMSEGDLRVSSLRCINTATILLHLLSGNIDAARTSADELPLLEPYQSDVYECIELTTRSPGCALPQHWELHKVRSHLRPLYRAIIERSQPLAYKILGMYEQAGKVQKSALVATVDGDATGDAIPERNNAHALAAVVDDDGDSDATGVEAASETTESPMRCVTTAPTEPDVVMSSPLHNPTKRSHGNGGNASQTNRHGDNQARPPAVIRHRDSVTKKPSALDRVSPVKKRDVRAVLQKTSDSGESVSWDEESGVVSPGRARPKINVDVKTRKEKVPFTSEEEDNIRAGVLRFSQKANKWSMILQNYWFHECRKGVHLKDKHRNMLRNNQL